MLTDLQIRKAVPSSRPVKLSDGGGLRLVVTPTGGKLWQQRYEFGGKEKLLSLGKYPVVSIAEARAARDRTKALLREGRDPGIAKKQQRLRSAISNADTFEALAREWHALQKASWAPVHWNEVLQSLQRDVFPEIGDMPMREIGVPEVLALLRSIEKRDAKETARRVRQRISAVFVFAIASERAEADPAAIVQKAMAPRTLGRQPAITDLEKARKVLFDAEATPGHAATKLALRLLAITAVRPGCLIRTPWTEFAEIDQAAPTWRIPAARLKLSLHHKSDEARDLLVPLPPQAIEVIETLRDLTGMGPIAFPNVRSAHKPMSENAIGYLLHRAGYHGQMVPHGWRSTFSTVMNERYPQDRHVIDLMLGHAPTNKVEAAYNRAAHMERRRELAALWADLICKDLSSAVSLLDLPAR